MKILSIASAALIAGGALLPTPFAQNSRDKIDAELESALNDGFELKHAAELCARLDGQFVSLTPRQKALDAYLDIEVRSRGRESGNLRASFQRLVNTLPDNPYPEAAAVAISELFESGTLRLPADEKLALLAILRSGIDAQRADRVPPAYYDALLRNEKGDTALAFRSALRAAADARRSGNQPVIVVCDDLLEAVSRKTAHYAERKVAAGEVVKCLGALQAPRLTRRYLARAEWSLGSSFHYLGDLPETELHLEQALKAALKYRDQDTLNVVATGLLLLYGNERRYDKFEEKVKFFQTIAPFAPDPTAVNIDLRIAQLYARWRQGRYPEAYQAWAEADRLDRARAPELRDEYFTDILESAHALVLTFTGRAAEAIPIAENATGRFAKWGNDTKESILATAVLFRAELGAGKYDAAENDANDLIQRLEKTASEVTDPAELGFYQETIPHPYGHLAWLYHLMGNHVQALLASERERGQGLAGELEMPFLSQFTKGETGEIASAQEALSAALYRLRELESLNRADNASVAQVIEQRRRVRLAEDSLKATRDRVFAAHPRAGAQLMAARQPWSERQRQALVHAHPDTLYLSYCLVDEEQTILLATSQGLGGVKSFVLPFGEQHWIDKSGAWLSAIVADKGVGYSGDSNAKERALARELDGELLGPLEKNGALVGAYKRVTVVDEGSLATIPFCALVQGDGRRLVERVVVSSAVSLASLDPAKATPPPGRSVRRFLCVADPEGKAYENDSKVPAGAASLTIEARRMPVGEGGAPGAFSRREGVALAQRFPDHLLLMGAKATIPRVRASVLGFDLVHFSCHGDVDSSNPRYNALLLAPASGAVKDDGRWTVDDIVSLGSVGVASGPRLAVLSACDAATGAAVGGDGVLSLAWGFIARGTPCVVASKWRVDEAETERLMASFYGSLRSQKPLPVDEALQKAQLSVLKVRPEPYYWAAFDAIGASHVRIPN